MLRKTLMLAIISSGFIPLSACNTVRGVGQDVQNVGNLGNCPTKVVWRNGRRVRVCR